MIAILMFAMVGCASSESGSNRSRFVSFNQTKTDSVSGLVHEKNASGIKWNDEYVVTAKHVDFVPGTVYESKEFDIRFVKMNSNKETLSWREPVAGEILTVIGNNGRNGVCSESGKDSNIAAYTDENGQIFIAKKEAVKG